MENKTSPLIYSNNHDYSNAISQPISDNSISLNQCGDQPTKISHTSSNSIIYQSLLNDFYGYDDPNTKWILTVLSSPGGIRRLQRHWKSKIRLLHSYFEIPDNPQLYPRLRGSKSSKLYTPAFHSLVSLYLNPLGICVYTQNEEALRFLLSYNINKLSDPCFIQKWWNKGEDKYLTDFCATDIINLVLRKSYFNCIPLLMVSGYNPMDRVYQIDHIQAADDYKTRSYQDSLDLALQLLNDLPGLNISRFFQIISNKSYPNYFDAIMFDFDRLECIIDGKRSPLYRLRSIFRLLLIQASIISQEKFLSKYLAILKTIQRLGYFKYLSKEFGDDGESQNILSGDIIVNVNKQKSFHFSCEGHFMVANELESERINRYELANKFKKGIFKSADYYKLLLAQDRQIILMILFSLISDAERRGKVSQSLDIAVLTVNILLDSYRLDWIFDDNKIPEIVESLDFDCCKIITKSSINADDIIIINKTLIKAIKYNKKLTSRVKAKNPGLLTEIIKKKPIRNKPSLPTKDKSEISCLTIKKKDAIVKNHFMFINGKVLRSWNRPKAPIVKPMSFNTPTNIQSSLMSLRQRITEMKLKDEEEEEIEERKKLRQTLLKQCRSKSIRNSPDITKSKISKSLLRSHKTSLDKTNNSHVISYTSTKLYPPPLIIRSNYKTEQIDNSLIENDATILRHHQHHKSEYSLQSTLSGTKIDNVPIQQYLNDYEELDDEEDDDEDDDDDNEDDNNNNGYNYPSCLFSEYNNNTIGYEYDDLDTELLTELHDITKK